MKFKVECPFCDGMANLKERPQEILYKKVLVGVRAYFYHCEKCHEEFTTTEIDTLIMPQVYN